MPHGPVPLRPRLRRLVAGMLTFVPLIPVASAQGEPLVLHGATVLPMTGDVAALPDHSVVVEDGAIRWVGPMDRVPAGGRVIDAAGLTLMPGLVDAHVHLFDADQLPLYVANGVTTVFNLSGTPFALTWREEIRAGTRVGPRSFASGPQVKDDPIAAVDTEVLLPVSPGDIEAFVTAHRDQGFEFVKVWSSIPPAAYENLLAECRRQGVRVTGHIPARVNLRGVVHSGQDSIAHVEEILNKFLVRDLDPRGLDAVASIAGEEDFAVISTLITYEMIADTMVEARFLTRMARDPLRYLDPFLVDLWASEQNDWYQLRRTDRGRDGYYDRALAFKHRITSVLAAAGRPILAGSDSGIVVANILPGWSLHRELELLAEAGLSPVEVLAAATSRGGEFLVPGSGLGTVAVGAPADLLLLEGNPLEDLSHTRSIHAVVARGRYFDRAGLDELLAEVESRLEPAKRFRDLVAEEGLEAAAHWVRGQQASGHPIPGEASFVVAAYHRATAGEIPAALALAELSVELRPNSYRSAYFLAGLLEMGGDTDRARATFERALELRPDHPWLPQDLARLR